MKLTNKQNLPQSVVNAVKRDPYNNQGTLSVTTLIKPPQMVRLEKEHFSEIEHDVSDSLWALYGQSIHHILERSVGEGDRAEVRLYMDVGGTKISGQYDLLTQAGILQDYKFTSVWAVKDCLKNGKTEWEQQLNILRVLCESVEEYPNIRKLEIIAFCRDWRNSEMLRDSGGYPRKVEVIDVPMWHFCDAVDFINERIDLHTSDDVQPCTDEERWVVPGKWAVMKKGRKSALRLLDTEGEACKWVNENGYLKDGIEFTSEAEHFSEFKSGISIEERPTKYNRCEGYCNCSKFCPQFNGG